MVRSFSSFGSARQIACVGVLLAALFASTVLSAPSAHAAVGAAWVPVVQSAPWQARTGHASVVFGGKMWILGGSPDASHAVVNDVWSSDNGIDWTQTLPAPPWAARVYHQALVFNGEMWVIGGWDGVSYVPRNADVWHSPDGIHWTQSIATAPWPGRNFFGAVVHSGRMWIMGGYDGNVGMNDVWSSSDGVSWTQATAGASWKKRTAISVLDYSGRMWLLGGFDPSNSGTFSDVWSSTDGATWIQETANAWPTRNAHSAVVYQGAMWIMGGATTALDYADVWTSTNGVSWTRATDSAWPKRWGQTSVVFDSKLWILGGVDPAISAIYHDVWYVDTGASLSGQVTAASTGAPAACSAVVVTPLGGGPERITTADSNGEYRMDGVSQGSYTVEIYAPGFNSQSRTLTIPTGSVTLANFSLAASTDSGGVRGTVSDSATSKPVPGIRVDAKINGAIAATTFTCADGGYQIVGLALKSTSVTLEFSSSSYDTTTQTVDVSAGSVTQSDAVVENKFAVPGALTGVVTRADGVTALSGARVTLEGLGNVTESTDSGGAYAFSSLPEGTYTVRASATGFGGQTQLASVTAFSSAPLDFRLLAAVKGDIDTNGALNASDVQLTINSALGLPAGYNCDIDKNGAVNAIDVQLVINAVLGLR